ncbi:Uncharacterised protein [Klebsiella pneumoniae]|nr:Uncharacterised protein [Klebsiella pneumoniae]
MHTQSVRQRYCGNRFGYATLQVYDKNNVRRFVNVAIFGDLTVGIDINDVLDGQRVLFNVTDLFLVELVPIIFHLFDGLLHNAAAQLRQLCHSVTSERLIILGLIELFTLIFNILTHGLK